VGGWCCCCSAHHHVRQCHHPGFEFHLWAAFGISLLTRPMRHSSTGEPSQRHRGFCETLRVFKIFGEVFVSKSEGFAKPSVRHEGLYTFAMRTKPSLPRVSENPRKGGGDLTKRRGFCETLGGFKNRPRVLFQNKGFSKTVQAEISLLKPFLTCNLHDTVMIIMMN